MRFTFWRILNLAAVTAIIANPAAAQCTLTNGTYSETDGTSTFSVDADCTTQPGEVVVGATLFEHPEAFMSDPATALSVSVPASLKVVDFGGDSIDLKPQSVTGTQTTLTYTIPTSKLGIARYMVFAAWRAEAKSNCSPDSDFGRQGCADFGFTLGGDSMEWDDDLLAAYPGKNDVEYDEETDQISEPESWSTARFR